MSKPLACSGTFISEIDLTVIEILPKFERNLKDIASSRSVIECCLFNGNGGTPCS